MANSSTNVGENGNLAVIVRKYVPNVQCHQRYPLEPSSCYSVLKMMPASTDRLTFGPRNGQGTQAIIPQQIQAGRSSNFLPSNRFPRQKLQRMGVLPGRMRSIGVDPRTMLICFSGHKMYSNYSRGTWQ